MNIREWTVLFVVALVLVFSPCVHAEWAKTQKETLKGIHSLYVTIENLHPDAAAIGLDSTILRKDIEGKFKTAGITIPFALIGNDDPYLNATITVHYNKATDFVYYALHISLLQPVALTRTSNLSFYGRTWFASSAGGAAKKEAVKVIREEISKKIDEFLKDYRAVNPEKK
jgi:hypothetical protein